MGKREETIYILLYILFLIVGRKEKTIYILLYILFLIVALLLSNSTVIMKEKTITTADPKKYEHENISKLCKDLKPHVKVLVNVG